MRQERGNVLFHVPYILHQKEKILQFLVSSLECCKQILTSDASIINMSC